MNKKFNIGDRVVLCLWAKIVDGKIQHKVDIECKITHDFKNSDYYEVIEIGKKIRYYTTGSSLRKDIQYYREERINNLLYGIQ